MDVICEQCKAEYEFDEALLGEKGTTVKCSSCGLVFRVMPANRAAGRSQLKLRYAKNGIVEGLGSLRELQQRIRAGEVGIDDELGRDGFPFRPLREVPELKNFFAAPLEKPTLPPRAAGPGESRGVHAAKTVEGRLPGSPGATLGGRSNDEDPFFDASTNPPPLPSQSARPAPLRGSTAPSRSPPALRGPVPTPRPGAGPSARPGLPSPSVAARGPTSRLPPLSKQTMLGVGPQGQQVPRAPRVPSFAQPTHPSADDPVRAVAPSGVPDPRGRAWSDPGAVRQPSPHATLHGAAGPNGPLGPGAPEPPAARGGIHNNRGGTLRPVHGAPAPEGESRLGHGQPAPYPSASDAGPRNALSEQDEESDASDEDASTRALIDRLRADARTPPVQEGRRLYLDDDETAPERVVGDSSRLWFFVIVLLLLGGGGWYYVTRVLYAPPARDEQAVTPEPASTPEGTTAAPTTEVDAQGPESVAEADTRAQLEPAAPEPGEAPPTAPAASAAPEAPAAPKPGAAEKPAADSKQEPASQGPATPAKTDRGPPPRAAERASAAADPEAYGPWVTKGDQLFARGDFAGAQRAFRAALGLRPGGSEANAGLGFALLGAGQAREALAFFDQAARAGYAEANIGLGDAYRKLGQPSSALEAYQEYLERLPTGSRASYARRELDRLKGSAGGAAPPASSSDSYRPAGEFLEPAAPSAPDPAPPSEIKP